LDSGSLPEILEIDSRELEDYFDVLSVYRDSFWI
jgi:hypothetical protein